MLSYIFVLHQTTTFKVSMIYLFGCLISLFYIKPQPYHYAVLHSIVVLYLCSTSNHNCVVYVIISQMLSYIFVLHQTTTTGKTAANWFRCLISLFYIKPQRDHWNSWQVKVVLYLCSTSNHNSSDINDFVHVLSYIFVLHQTTTLQRKADK